MEEAWEEEEEVAVEWEGKCEGKRRKGKEGSEKGG